VVLVACVVQDSAENVYGPRWQQNLQPWSLRKRVWSAVAAESAAMESAVAAESAAMEPLGGIWQSKFGLCGAIFFAELFVGHFAGLSRKLEPRKRPRVGAVSRHNPKTRVVGVTIL